MKYLNCMKQLMCNPQLEIIVGITGDYGRPGI